MTAAPTKRTTLPTLQTAITKTRAQHAASPPTTLPLAGGEASLHYSLHNGKRTQAQAFT